MPLIDCWHSHISILKHFCYAFQLGKKRRCLLLTFFQTRLLNCLPILQNITRRRKLMSNIKIIGHLLKWHESVANTTKLFFFANKEFFRFPLLSLFSRLIVIGFFPYVKALNSNSKKNRKTKKIKVWLDWLLVCKIV